MLVLKSTYKKLKDEYYRFLHIMMGNVIIEKSVKPIEKYSFPEVVLKRTKQELDIDDKKLKLVIIDFFDYMKTVQRYKTVDILSKTTDVLWHNLIIDTEAYLDFCLNYVGFFVHHKPYLEDKKITNSDLRLLSKRYNSIISDDVNYRNYRNDNIIPTNDMSTYLLLYSLLDSSNFNEYPSKNNTLDTNTSQISSTSDYSGSCSSKSSCSSSSCSSSSCGSSGCGS